jgi:hypothetical protein
LIIKEGAKIILAPTFLPSHAARPVAVVAGRFACASSGKGNGDGGSVHVVRHLGDDDDVVLAESEPCCVDFAAEFLDGWFNSLDPVLRVVDYCLPAFTRSDSGLFCLHHVADCIVQTGLRPAGVDEWGFRSNSVLGFAPHEGV